MANTTRTRRAGLMLLLGTVSLSALGCATTTISHILAEPLRYTRHNDVSLKGNVTESVSSWAMAPTSSTTARARSGWSPPTAFRGRARR
jgi:hypothetical protein